MNMKRLGKSTTNVVLSGVCGGIAEYFNIDPTIVRLIWALLTVMSVGFPGLILYIVCAIVMPRGVYNEPGPDDYTPYSDRAN